MTRPDADRLLQEMPAVSKMLEEALCELQALRKEWEEQVQQLLVYDLT